MQNHPFRLHSPVGLKIVSLAKQQALQSSHRPKRMSNCQQTRFSKGAIPRFDQVHTWFQQTHRKGGQKSLLITADFYLFYIGCSIQTSPRHCTLAVPWIQDDPRFLKENVRRCKWENDGKRWYSSDAQKGAFFHIFTVATTSDDYNNIERYNYTLESNKTNS